MKTWIQPKNCEMHDTNPDLACLIDGLKSRFGRNLKTIVLFGSRARGEATEQSDYDVLVVADDLPSEPLSRMRMVRAVLLEYPMHANFIAKTTAEFESDLTPLLLDICADGRVLCGENYFEPLRARALEAVRQAGLERREIDGEYYWAFRNGAPAAWELNWEGYRELAA